MREFANKSPFPDSKMEANPKPDKSQCTSTTSWVAGRPLLYDFNKERARNRGIEKEIIACNALDSAKEGFPRLSSWKNW